jgi:hypothetical protein
MVTRINRRAAESSTDVSEARANARSAVEVGRWLIAGNADWRTKGVNGFWRKDQPLGRGLYSIEVEDPADGDLDNDDDGRVIVTGTGKVGAARYRLSVELAPEEPPGISSLASSVHAATLLQVNQDTTVNAPLSSNGNIIIAGGSDVIGDAEAVGTVTVLGSLSGTKTDGIPPKEQPSDPFPYYGANGVVIDISAIPAGNVTDALFSPNSNPYGATLHPDGLYVINCGGAKLTIENTRVVGTLVILDCGVGSRIQFGIHWVPFNARLPALMVRGPMNLGWSGTLQEGGPKKVNFNPPGTPYNGVSDTDWTDSYPSKMQGLIYVSGDLTFSQPMTIEGVVLSGGATTTIQLNLTVVHDPTIILDPPPGFERVNRPMRVVTGSWKRVVD